MRILADENIPRSVVAWLRENGHDVATVYDLNKVGADDNEIIIASKEEQRVILTLDLDFGYMYYFSKNSPIDVIIIRTSPAIPENIVKLLKEFFKTKAEPKGLIIVSERKIRILNE